MSTPAVSSSSKPALSASARRRAVIIVGRSVSTLAKAAKLAGYKPLVLDSFGDIDTREAAGVYRKLHYCGDVIDPGRLYQQLQHLTDRYGVVPLCWGSGWEASGHILSALACRHPLVGSHPRALLRLARPAWVKMLGEDIAVQPELKFAPARKGALLKQGRRSGGHSVHFAIEQKFLASGWFREAFLRGRSVSIVAVAHGNGADIIGYSEHFSLQSNARYPFRQSAAVTTPPFELSEKLLRGLQNAARDLKLSGLFGVDLIIDEGANARILELNPRPTATVPLHLSLDKVFAWHAEPSSICGHTLNPARVAKANAVVYADSPITLTKKLHWPTWVSDVPSQNRVYANGEPLCVIWAEADTSEEAKTLLIARLDELLAMFQTK